MLQLHSSGRMKEPIRRMEEEEKNGNNSVKVNYFMTPFTENIKDQKDFGKGGEGEGGKSKKTFESLSGCNKSTHVLVNHARKCFVFS
jgi:hypothetical protein